MCVDVVILLTFYLQQALDNVLLISKPNTVTFALSNVGKIAVLELNKLPVILFFW